ncbi:FtsH protease activity modulator HflK [Gymnodinialimonas ceratoperidinii]|uniref:Protein HflK n=1 Tax=Gymnodinialimonas ceratoperidinii TaxID=2856823 RepID=A0A8F6U044_9RHOB|nr:FtsH protease activity modulator HflK [Gymnodinialimonas ceratoperidinii]QXT40922.1 FtsH protease activity modulator HflK [Gymnodinialimonas ceratoperidinii]
MAGNSGGPWGGGSNNGGSGGGGNRGTGGGNGNNTGPRRPGGEGQNIPELDDIMRKGQEQLRVLMGGRGGGTGGTGSGKEPINPRAMWIGGILLVALAWLYASFYSVQPGEQGVELFLGSEYRITGDGPHLAPWPLVTAEVISTEQERTEAIGNNRSGASDTGLMLTTDENIVDIDFDVVWNISNPADYLFNLRDPEATIRAVAESAMREIIAQSELAPILNRDRQLIGDQALALIQSTMDSYESGVNIIRINLDRADPPVEVIDAFREVQAAEQERDRLERTADAYSNRVTAGARGEAAQVLEEAEGYRARVVNEALGEASRFLAILQEYEVAPEVTRRRLYLETLERVLSDTDLVIIDGETGGASGVVPYLPLNELRRPSGDTETGGSN